MVALRYEIYNPNSIHKVGRMAPEPHPFAPDPSPIRLEPPPLTLEPPPILPSAPPFAPEPHPFALEALPFAPGPPPLNIQMKQWPMFGAVLLKLNVLPPCGLRPLYHLK